jgi:23S rRNA (adenine2503-C2)-methyltransferase
MGMGEPLLNIPAVVTAATYMKEQMGMSGRAITISTVGMPNAIRKLAEHQLTATLAVSIHAPNQELREQLIPSAKIYPIPVSAVVALSLVKVMAAWFTVACVC